MSFVNHIEHSVRDQLLTKTAVRALVGSGDSARVRAYKFSQKDDLATDGPGILIRVNKEEPQNDMGCQGGLVIADVSIISCAVNLDAARELAEAIRSNGTNPGTGLAGDDWTIIGIPGAVESCCLIYSSLDFIPFGDDSDEGIFTIDSHYTIIFDETR